MSGSGSGDARQALAMARLQGIAALRRDLSLGRVAKVLAEIGALESELSGLRAALAARDGLIGFDAARAAGAETAWRGWAKTRQRALLARIAGLRAAHEEALAEARRDFGRCEVLAKLSGPGRRGA